jgi:hypothetical protein
MGATESAGRGPREFCPGGTSGNSPFGATTCRELTDGFNRTLYDEPDVTTSAFELYLWKAVH